SMLESERQKFIAAFSASRGLESRLQPEKHLTMPGDGESHSGVPAEAGTPNLRPLVGFAVMGGIFGEGIDLIGDRLVGAVIVGVGLPQLCVERDLIRGYFQEKNGCGFEYAYVYPGLNRVIQAAGRVIRSETDRGVVLLMDRRFGQPRYQKLLPKWWLVTAVRSEAEIAHCVKEFSAGFADSK